MFEKYPELMNTGQAAEVLQTTPWNVRKWCHEKKLP